MDNEEITVKAADEAAEKTVREAPEEAGEKEPKFTVPWKADQLAV